LTNVAARHVFVPVMLLIQLQ